MLLGVLVLAYFAVGLWALGWFLNNDSGNVFGFVLGIVAFFGFPFFLVEPSALSIVAWFFGTFFCFLGLVVVLKPCLALE
jgi:hypothetical protein